MVTPGTSDGSDGTIWWFTVTNQRFGGVPVLAPAGRIGTQAAPLFDRALAEATMAGGQSLVVDFTQVTYISRPGLESLDAAARRADVAGGQLVLCGLQGPVRLAFDLAGLLTRFPVEGSLEQAVARCSSPTPPSTS